MGWKKDQGPGLARVGEEAGCAVNGQLRAAVAAGRVTTATPERTRERPKGVRWPEPDCEGQCAAGAPELRASGWDASVNTGQQGRLAMATECRYACFPFGWQKRIDGIKCQKYQT